MTHPTHNPSTQAAAKRPAAFTLIELLIVIGVIVLMVAAAVPLFNAMRGTRSIEAAQNQVASLLVTARTDALALQRTTGLLFYMDNDRVKVATVYASDPQPADNAPGAPRVDIYLDLVDREHLSLPSGVGCQVLDNPLNSKGQSVDRYIGYNRPGNNPTLREMGGAILFDARGRLVSQQYGYRVGYGASGRRDWSAMGKLLYPGGDFTRTAPPDLPAPNSPIQPLASQFGLVLFNAEQFKGAGGSREDMQVTGAIVAANSPEFHEEQWLDNNAIPLMVNQYNGALIKGE